MNRLLICVDVDGVCANLHPVWLRRYAEITGRLVRPEDIRSWDFGGLQLDKRILFGILDEPNLYDEVKEVEDAYMGVKCLRLMGHRVVFCTSSTPAGATSKMFWLAEHGFIKGRGLNVWRDVVICHDKSLLYGDVLVDDHAGNLETFRGKAKILFDQPHNRSLVEKGFVRLYGWHDVVNYILRLGG